MSGVHTFIPWPGVKGVMMGVDGVKGVIRVSCMAVFIAGVWRTSIAGGIAGCCFWTAIFPTDVIRTRIQVSCMLIISSVV